MYFSKCLFKSETNSLVIPNIAVCNVNEGKVILEIRIFYKSFEVSFSKSKFCEVSTNNDEGFTLHLFSLIKHYHIFEI